MIKFDYVIIVGKTYEPSLKNDFLGPEGSTHLTIFFRVVNISMISYHY